VDIRDVRIVYALCCFDNIECANNQGGGGEPGEITPYGVVVSGEW